MPPAAFEPAIPASERLYAHALYGVASGISKVEYREASMEVFLTYFVTDSAINSRICVSSSKCVHSDFIGI
jgi:hypothetical protein